jgi:ribonuclease Z
VTAFPVSHRGPDCLGYLFEERARRPFLPERADELGIPFGPERRDLVDGKDHAAQRQTVGPGMCSVPFRRGRLVIGDAAEGRPGPVRPDVVGIESTYLNQEAEMARQFSHLTAQQAAELGVRAGARHLILTHISRRYREKDVLKEAQAVHPHVSVARDFDSFHVKREEE